MISVLRSEKRILQASTRWGSSTAIDAEKGMAFIKLLNCIQWPFGIRSSRDEKMTESRSIASADSRWAFSAPMTLSFSRTLPSTLMIDDELIQKIWWSFEDISFESSIVDSINDYGRHSNANNSRKGAFSLTKENVSRIDLRLNEDG